MKLYLIHKSVKSTINMEKRELETEEALLLRALETFSISLEWVVDHEVVVEDHMQRKENLFLNH